MSCCGHIWWLHWHTLEVPLEFLDLNNDRTLVVVIELNRKDIILVVKALHGSLGIDYVA
jgi:hypothetical protein